MSKITDFLKTNWKPLLIGAAIAVGATFAYKKFMMGKRKR